MKVPPSLRTAFSLVEMLVVISIIGIISSFAIPAATKMVRGTDVTRASQMLADQLSSARQYAIIRNKQIEVRFIRFADPEQPGETVADDNTWKFRGIQLLEVTTSGIPVQIGPIQRIPGSLLLNDGKYSSLLDQSGASSSGSARPLVLKHPTALDPAMPRVKDAEARKYTYCSFRFMPDGSTDLSVNGTWFVTMHLAADSSKLTQGSGAGGDPIKSVNYFTLQIDPVSGATHTFRPQLG